LITSNDNPALITVDEDVDQIDAAGGVPPALEAKSNFQVIESQKIAVGEVECAIGGPVACTSGLGDNDLLTKESNVRTLFKPI